jgi:hypothetical protein
MATDFQRILKILEQSNVDHCSSIYIKSLDKSSDFKKFTGKQNKDFVEILTKSPIFQFHFLDNIYKLLKDLSLDTSLKVEDLTVVDRILAIIQLRIANVGKTIVIDDVEIDLEKHIDAKKVISIPENIDLTSENFHIVLGYPDLRTENAFEKLLLADIEKFKMGDEKEHRMILSTIFLYNVLSYIKSISIESEGNVIDFDYANKSVVQKIEIGKSISSIVIIDIMKKMHEHFDETLKALTTVVVDEVEYQIDLNPNFFLQ